MGRLQAHTLFPLLTERNAPAPTTNKKPAFRRFLIAALTRTAKRPPALLTERNAPALCAKVHNKKPAFRRVLIVSNGGPDKDRTCDLLHAMQALSQLSYRPFIKLISKVLLSNYINSISIFWRCGKFFIFRLKFYLRRPIQLAP